MKTSDIKVGEHYAYFNHKYASGVRVEVLETGVAQTQGYSYSRRTVKSGVRVKQVGGPRDGVEFTVTARQIERPWAEQERINERAREAREAREDSARKTAARRANLARRIEDRLAAHGVEVRPYKARINDRAQNAALRANGFKWVEDDTSLYNHGFVTRITDLDDLMRNGDVAERDVEVLLADAEVSA